MGSNLIELTPELFDQDLRIDPILKPLHRETFIAKLGVEDSFDPFCQGVGSLIYLMRLCAFIDGSHDASAEQGKSATPLKLALPSLFPNVHVYLLRMVGFTETTVIKTSSLTDQDTEHTPNTTCLASRRRFAANTGSDRHHLGQRTTTSSAPVEKCSTT
jgi:hypothetical protein